MKNKVRYIFIGIISLIVIISGIVITLNIINDENKITVDEKKWLNTNLSTLQSVNVVNDSPIFGTNGYGIFYEFINDFSNEYQLKVNPVTYNLKETEVSDGFKLTNTLSQNSVVMYEDNYVLIGKNNDSVDNLSNLNIGVLSSDQSYLASYIRHNLNAYGTYAELEHAFEEGTTINYMIVPKTLYLDYVLKNNYYILLHYSDIKTYYVYEMKENDTLSSVIKKYFNTWKDKKLESYYNSNLLSSLTYDLSIKEADLASLRANTYQYGFVSNNPYEVLVSGNYGGVVAEYLQNFSDLTNIEFKFTKYKNYNQFVNAINDNKIDLYFNYYNNNFNFENVSTKMSANYVVIARNNNDTVINSLNSLQNKKVYVLQDSIIASYLSNINNIEINYYQDIDELKRLANKDNIIIVDKDTYEFLSKKELRNYNIRYTYNTNSYYDFKVKGNNSFTKLFASYVMIQDPNYIKVLGLNNHDKTVKMGSFYGTIAIYILIVIIAVIFILYLWYKSSKKIKVFKKIKKEDKIKFIDQLTSLKNRNYLNENIDAWNKNKIYPQATIIIDLNKIQEINDTKGYDEGDRQIKAASNILIRTQLDNSDIIRTDGNEFLIYTIGYDNRHVQSYIRKLIKEFKSLPYDYNAIITHAMIENDLKTIEDAINEAVDDMKEKKQEL